MAKHQFSLQKDMLVVYLAVMIKRNAKKIRFKFCIGCHCHCLFRINPRQQLICSLQCTLPVNRKRTHGVALAKIYFPLQAPNSESFCLNLTKPIFRYCLVVVFCQDHMMCLIIVSSQISNMTFRDTVIGCHIKERSADLKET